MGIKRNFTFLFILLSLLTFLVYTGCSSEMGQQKTRGEIEKEKYSKEFKERLKKEMQKKGQDMQYQVDSDKTISKRQRNDAEACQREFELCIERCKNKKCEDACIDFLSACEKDIPIELQTLKQQ